MNIIPQTPKVITSIYVRLTGNHGAISLLFSSTVVGSFLHLVSLGLGCMPCASNRRKWSMNSKPNVKANIICRAIILRYLVDSLTSNAIDAKIFPVYYPKLLDTNPIPIFIASTAILSPIAEYPKNAVCRAMNPASTPIIHKISLGLL